MAPTSPWPPPPTHLQLSLILWRSYISPPPPYPRISLQARPALPPMTGRPGSDGLVQVSGTKRTDGRSQRRTNYKGALLFSSSGWLGSSFRHEQDKPTPPQTPTPLVPCEQAGDFWSAGQDYNQNTHKHTWSPINPRTDDLAFCSFFNHPLKTTKQKNTIWYIHILQM